MSQQDILIIIAFVAIRALAQLEPRRPYEPPGPVAVAFLIAFEVIAGLPSALSPRPPRGSSLCGDERDAYSTANCALTCMRPRAT
jgi:hypothetical protein